MSGIFEHRKLPEEGNPTPEAVSVGFAAASDFIASYGWYILFAIIALVCLNSWLDTRLQGWRKQRKQHREYSRLNADEVLKRQEAMDRARDKLQAKYNTEAEEYAKKLQEQNEQKSKEQIEDWDRHQRGMGYRSKKKAPENEEPPASSRKTEKPKRTRDDYNPLWGGQGSGFRPARRGFSSGG